MALRRPSSGRRPSRRLATAVICMIAGLMMSVSAMAARGTDLRSDRAASIREVVEAQSRRNEELRQQSEDLRAEIDELTAKQDVDPTLTDDLAQAAVDASTGPVTGPGVRVTLTDAPLDVKPAGVDEDSLVVHQQDIQAVVNALWEGGAEAMTIQGQRVISTTGIKCVGNSVVLHGVPYAPPYVIQAIGDETQLRASLDWSPAIIIYKQYVDAYGLGYEQHTVDSMDFPGFVGSVGLDVATPSG